jgi:hypothetical protein
MADNLGLPFTGAGSSATGSVATDDIGGVHYQRAKVVWGVDGAAVDTSATNPLPVDQTSKATALDDGTNFSVTDGLAVEVLAANPTRVQATVIPEADVYMSIGGTATSSSPIVKIDTPWNFPAGYKGSVSMLSVTGTINVKAWDI